MCGRLACGLEPEQIRYCCHYQKSTNNDLTLPDWKNIHNFGKTYKPSYNICPSEVAPVLLSGCHFNSDIRTVAPMIFGLIPNWLKNVDTTNKYSTINCRIENIKSSKLYCPLLKKGQRCIVICNGFFEWKKKGKQSSLPYFIYLQQEDDISMSDPSSWNINNLSLNNECNGFKPLKMAALFEKQIQEGSDKDVYSFTILTKESSTKMSWLHHRMPVFIETEEQLEVWLNSEKYDEDQALQSLSHFENVLCYPVSSAVNITSNKGITCIKLNEKPLEVKNKNQNSSLFMKNWLKKRPAEEKKDKCQVKAKQKKI